MGGLECIHLPITETCGHRQRQCADVRTNIQHDTVSRHKPFDDAEHMPLKYAEKEQREIDSLSDVHLVSDTAPPDFPHRPKADAQERRRKRSCNTYFCRRTQHGR